MAGSEGDVGGWEVTGGTARRMAVRGIVQGVGFRPHTAALADRHGLCGWVRNAKAGVILQIEGPGKRIEEFARDLVSCAPRMAAITGIETETVPLRGFTGFCIRDSDDGGQRELLMAPDASVCSDCAREVMDPEDRHYRYPFTNCTNCGPRFTIVRGLPYDRSRTSMADFPMCPDCEKEYRDHRDRRFHAQPVACPRCGPRVWLEDAGGRLLARDDGVWRRLGQILRGGKLVGVRGIGGVHIACSACSEAAVTELRRRKSRPTKPVAIMVRDVAAAGKICRVTPTAEALLTSPQAPIVVMTLRENPGISLALNLAPGMRSLGVMLPYTPLHMLLLQSGPEALVMTSGNRRGLPLVTENAAARRELGCMADFLLLHDRPIARRCDDSVVRVVSSGDGGGIGVMLRRSRGYAPRPVMLGRGVARPGPAVLGSGGDERNTFCLLSGDEAFLSQHMGTVRYEETVRDYRRCLDDLTHILEIEPEVVACDLHPEYRTSILASELSREWGARLVRIQHHHAHHAACLSERGHGAKAIGLVADGLGYGDDGTFWGMEVLFGDPGSCRRLLSLAPVPMPGGDRAIKRPLRMALAHIWTFMGRQEARRMMGLFPREAEDLEVALAQMERGLNSPMTSSCGRLFDAVSAILGLCRRAHYSGEAAVRLSEAASWGDEPLPFSLKRDGDLHRWDLVGMWEALLGRLRERENVPEIASAFQRTVGEMLLQGARLSREMTGCDVVALSGGVFQNPTILSRMRASLAEEGFTVLIPGEVPPGDGALSLGQAVAARWKT
ncbi:MAG: carbamoyltransferase HypF [Bacillota bacterium]